MTILLYARRKEWPLVSVTINSTHEQIERIADVSQSESNLSLIDVIRQSILIEDSLSEKQSDRIRHLARRCPIHRVLENGLIIEESVEVVAE